MTGWAKFLAKHTKKDPDLVEEAAAVRLHSHTRSPQAAVPSVGHRSNYRIILLSFSCRSSGWAGVPASRVENDHTARTPSAATNCLFFSHRTLFCAFRLLKNYKKQQQQQSARRKFRNKRLPSSSKSLHFSSFFSSLKEFFHLYKYMTF